MICWLPVPEESITEGKSKQQDPEVPGHSTHSEEQKAVN